MSNDNRIGFKCIFCGLEVAHITNEWLKTSTACICPDCTQQLEISVVPVPVTCMVEAAWRDEDDPKRTVIVVNKAFLPESIVGGKAIITTTYGMETS